MGSKTNNLLGFQNAPFSKEAHLPWHAIALFLRRSNYNNTCIHRNILYYHGVISSCAVATKEFNKVEKLRTMVYEWVLNTYSTLHDKYNHGAIDAVFCRRTIT